MKVEKIGMVTEHVKSHLQRSELIWKYTDACE